MSLTSDLEPLNPEEWATKKAVVAKARVNNVLVRVREAQNLAIEEDRDDFEFEKSDCDDDKATETALQQLKDKYKLDVAIETSADGKPIWRISGRKRERAEEKVDGAETKVAKVEESAAAAAAITPPTIAEPSQPSSAQ